VAAFIHLRWRKARKRRAIPPASQRSFGTKLSGHGPQVEGPQHYGFAHAPGVKLATTFLAAQALGYV
jgi:hypothetical protein